MDQSMHHMDMDHGGHGSHDNHDGMDMPMKCSMNMLFTWSSDNLCIIFRGWHVTGPFSLIFSLVLIVLLTAGYEGVREMTRRYESRTAVTVAREPSASLPTDIDVENAEPYADDISSSHKATGQQNDIANASTTTGIPESQNDSTCTYSRIFLARYAPVAPSWQKRRKVILAILYAIQVFYSFFIMLLFMTYNGWVMLAVAVGAFVGYMVFGQLGASSATKSVSCH